MHKVEILNKKQVGNKINRMSYEIWEHYAEESELYILGVEGSGEKLAGVFFKELQKISDLKLQLGKVHIDKNNLSNPIEADLNNLKDKNVLLVDDVCNTGRTLLYSLQPIINQHPANIKTAVLVNRKHKKFPVKPDIVGLEMSTTLQDHILVEVDEFEKISVYLS